MSDRDRFEAKVDRSAGPDGCHLWTRGQTHNGYGRFSVGSRTVRAHRYAYEAIHGPIPAGLEILHACDTPLCVNDRHLSVGTQADNNADAVAKGRARSARGERHGGAKLTEAAVAEIRSLYAAGGVTQQSLAARFGVSFQQISDIVRGRYWRAHQGEEVA